jgi:hypothetical protein
MNKSRKSTYLMCTLCDDIFKIVDRKDHRNEEYPHCKVGKLEEIEIRKVKV